MSFNEVLASPSFFPNVYCEFKVDQGAAIELHPNQPTEVNECSTQMRPKHLFPAPCSEFNVRQQLLLIPPDGGRRKIKNSHAHLPF